MKSSKSIFRDQNFLLSCVALAVFLTGCATSRDVRVRSEPDDVVVSFTPPPNVAEVPPVSDGETASLRFPDDPAAEWLITVSKEGYFPETRHVRVDEPSGDPLLLDVQLRAEEFAPTLYVDLVLRDGEWIGVVREARAYDRTLEAGGEPPARIVDFGEQINVQALALSPDGDRIVFSVASTPPEEEIYLDDHLAVDPRFVDVLGINIRSVSVSGGGVQQITAENYRDMYPAFTPDGQHLLFSSNRRRPAKADILRISMETLGGISNIYMERQGGMALRATQAENGLITYSSIPDRRNAEPEIWTLGGANQYPTQIGYGSQPHVSPNGELVAYIGESGHLWVSRTDGSNKTQLTFNVSDIRESYRNSLTPREQEFFDFYEENEIKSIQSYSYPTWSPDGEYIIYTSMEGNDPTGRPNEDIWIMMADGSDKQQLTTNGSADRFPVVSPDGESIFFLSNRGQRWGIWRMSFPDN